MRTQGGSREDKKGGKEEEGVESPESWDLGGGNEVEDSCSFLRGTMREMGRVVSKFHKCLDGILWHLLITCK